MSGSQKGQVDVCRVLLEGKADVNQAKKVSISFYYSLFWWWTDEYNTMSE